MYVSNIVGASTDVDLAMSVEPFNRRRQLGRRVRPALGSG